MILKGFKFGMILQLAVGPICLFIFNLASNKGFLQAESAVLAVVTIDATYILLALLGIGTLIEKKQIKSGLTIFGSIIIAIFGLNTILEVLGWHVLPSLKINPALMNHSFLNGLILTAGNPLTILFWAGIFSTKVTAERLTKQEVYYFGLGAVLATLFFLTAISVVGSFTRYFLPVIVTKVLNLIVGFTLLYFSVRMLTKKKGA